MKENKRLEQWRWVTYFDSESDLDRQDEKILHKPKLICATYLDRLQTKRELVDYEGADLCHNFYADLSERVYEHTTCYVLAHNVGYDLMATGGIDHLTRMGWTVDSLYEKGFTYILHMRKGRKKLTFLSSTQYWPSKLADVAPLFGLKKLVDIGHATQDFEKLREYARQDVAIVEAAMEWLQSFIHDNDLGGMAQTLPSLAMRAFRHKFMQYPPVIHNYEPVTILERAAYHGGRTEAWFIGKVPEKLYKLDVNSLYPAVMASCLHPVRLVRLYPEGSLPLLHQLMAEYWVIADVTVSLEQPQVPLRKEKGGKLLFPIGTFNSVLCSPELQSLGSANIHNVRAIAVYDSRPIFREFVQYFYSQRLLAKHNGDIPRAELLKLVMNSLYGKFGQQSTEWVRLGDAPPDVVKSEDLLLPSGEHIRLRTFGGSTWVNDGRVMESFESFPAIAASVTSSARALLWQFIGIAGMENVYYMDTDSLFVNQRGYDALVGSGKVDPTALGLLKLEDESEDVEIYGAKNYRFGASRKFKGVPHDAEIVDVGGEKKAKVWTWPKAATWLREGRLGGFENRAVLKSMETTYTKGKIMASGRVEPLRLPDEL